MKRVSPSPLRQLCVAALFLLAVTIIAGAGGWASSTSIEDWYAEANKVFWNPPNWVFGPAWTLLYLALALSGFLLWRSGFRGSGTPNAARKPLMIYTVQLVLNGVWTPIFFAGYPVIGSVSWWIALAVILSMIVLTIWLIAASWRRSRTAAGLLVPYLLWLAFASSLNAGIIALN